MDSTKKLQHRINELVGGRQRLKLLEVGCGSKSHLCFENAHSVGLDTSKKQLDRNEDISERIQADIQYWDSAESAFDVIVCWDVVEHLKYPRRAIKNCLSALKPDGILVLAAPNPLSLWGLITKYTPSVFHLFYYRYILGSKHAGKKEVGPFRTYMRWSMRPKEVAKLACSQRYKVVYLDIYEGILQKKLRRKYILADWLFSLISMCFKGSTESSFIIVIQKPSEVVRSLRGKPKAEYSRC